MSKLKSKKFPKSSLGQDWNEEKSERELGVYCSLKKGLPLLNSMLSKSQSMLRQETATVCQKRVKCSVCLWKCRLGDKCPHSAWGIWTCTFRRNRSFNCSSSLPLVSLIVVAVRNWHHFQTSEEAVIRRHVMPLFEKNRCLPTWTAQKYSMSIEKFLINRRYKCNLKERVRLKRNTTGYFWTARLYFCRS